MTNSNRNKKRYYQIFSDKEFTFHDVPPAKRGMARVRSEALELGNLLRTYTARMIGLENAFRSIARDFSGLDGSNWRNNRHLSTPELSALAERLYKMDPSDWREILKIENELEQIALNASKERSSK